MDSKSIKKATKKWFYYLDKKWSFFDDFIYQLKKKNLSNFFHILTISSDRINYHIFKNSIKNGQYEISKKNL